MIKTILGAFALCAIVAVTACSASMDGSSALPGQVPQPSFGNLSVGALQVLEAPRFALCPQAPSGYDRCFGIGSAFGIASDAQRDGSCLDLPGCYGPADLQGAYNIVNAARTGGKGVTVAAVDAYGYPEAKSDLAKYRALWKLPRCPKCLTVVNQTGGKGLPQPGTGKNSSWQNEEALDVDMITAACPNCRILLVQANSASTTDLLTAETTALSKATIVSNSWGAGEQIATLPVFDAHPGKVITASAGDGGAGSPAGGGYSAAPETQPCGFAGVICVGGTSLQASGGRYVSEKVWQDFHVKIKGKVYDLGATGSGCSALVAKPAWQTDTGCKMRSAADISANADPLTGVVISCTPCAKAYGYKSPLLGGYGGTSESSPLIAGMYALAGNAGTLSNPSATLYSKGGTNDFHDVVSGYNDKRGQTGLVCTKNIKYICVAGTGYDGPTGWGSPNGVGAL